MGVAKAPVLFAQFSKQALHEELQNQVKEYPVQLTFVLFQIVMVVLKP